MLTVALSILLDSTSPGPDPLALASLGWAYGGGGGGGMGDWDGCHYMPGSIGATLRVLQDQVALKYKEEIPSYPEDYLDEEAWWLQDHDVEYGPGMGRPATRFCTVGGVPPLVTPYDKQGIMWGPPVAGVCVPSSCTARGLYTLFDEEVGFADMLLELSTSDGFYDEAEGTPGMGPPTASRRFRYMSSLAQSFTAGRTYRMGIICEGESGLKELDEEGFTTQGFYATTVLTCVLLVCVLIGTVSANLCNGENKRSRADGNKESRKETKTERINQSTGASEHKTRLMTPSNALNDYGSRGIIPNSPPKSPPIRCLLQSNAKPSFLGDENKDHDEEGTQNTEDYGLVNIEKDIDASHSLHEFFDEILYTEKPQEENCCTTFMERIKSTFAYFDASQSFYEITRMKRENPFIDSLHEQKLQQMGETSLDPYNSHHGLFPMYKSGGINDLKRRSSKRTISISSSKCLNGMRSISMIWIIFGHTLAVQSSIGYQNPAAVLPPTGMVSSALGTLFLSARYAVDTFFFIGGYLVMSGMLKRLDPCVGKVPTAEEEIQVDRWEMKLAWMHLINPKHIVVGEYGNRLNKIDPHQKRVKGLSWMVPFLLHRILRILPTYGFVLMLWWKVAVTMGDGPFWPRWATFVAQCDAQWWTNMLFVNNLVPRNQPFGETSECMYHAWYLGVDFQLCAVLTPIFLSLFLRKGWRKATIAIEALLIAGIIGTAMKFSYQYGWSAHLFDGSDTVSFDRGFYINPFFRSSPYIMGFITAQLWHEKCRLWPNMGLTKGTSIILSLFSIALLLFLALGTGASDKRPCLIWESPHTTDCGSGWSREKLAIFNSFTRPAWGLGLAIISLLSFNGQLKAFGSSSILTWTGWDPIGKLSFSMYLLHPLIINIWVLGGASKNRYSHASFFYAFAGIVTITFIAAVVVGILVEWPMSKITRDIEKRIWSSSATISTKDEPKSDDLEILVGANVSKMND